MSTYELQNIDAAQRDVLLGFGVQYHAWGENNILVDGEDQLELALQVLDLKVAKRKSQQDNMVSLKLKPGYLPTVHPAATVAARTPVQAETVPTQAVPTQPVPTETRRRVPWNGSAADRLRYVEICRERLERQIQQARENVERTTKAFQDAARTFLGNMRQTTFAEERPQADWDARFQAELRRTIELEKVIDVKVTNNGFTVVTDTLYIDVPDSGKRYEIGAFHIHIRLSGETAGVFFINRTRRVNGVRASMNAPYVFADGTPMTDDVTEVMTELLGRGEIAAITDLAIQYIETVQPDNPLTADLPKWPEAVL